MHIFIFANTAINTVTVFKLSLEKHILDNLREVFKIF